MAEALPMWIVYERPSDYPDEFVARLWMVDADDVHPTDRGYRSDTLLGLRMQLPVGLTCLTRAPEDEPSIVETWF